MAYFKLNEKENQKEILLEHINEGSKQKREWWADQKVETDLQNGRMVEWWGSVEG